MDTEWIVGLVGLVSGGGMGVIGSLLTLKAQRKKAMAEADNAAIEPLKQAIEILRTELNNANSDSKDKDKELDAMREKHLQMSLHRAALCNNLCMHKGCAIRKPTAGFGLKWLEEHESEEDLGGDWLPIDTLYKMYQSKKKKIEAGESDELTGL